MHAYENIHPFRDIMGHIDERTQERTKSVRRSQVCHVSPSCRVKSKRSAHSDRAGTRSPAPVGLFDNLNIPFSDAQHREVMLLLTYSPISLESDPDRRRE